MDEQTDALADPKDKTVLIVDDDEGQRDLLSHLIGKAGFRIAEAKTGAEALQKVRESAPDLIVLDLMLPGMGGYEILREFQASGSGDIPVVIVSAREMDQKMINTLTCEPNVRDFFAKPPRPEVFSARLHALLQTRPPPRIQSGDVYGPG